MQNRFVPETRTNIAYDKFKRWAIDEGYDERRQVPAINGFSQRVEAAGKGISKKRTAAGATFVGLGCKGLGLGAQRAAADNDRGDNQRAA